MVAPPSTAPAPLSGPLVAQPSVAQQRTMRQQRMERALRYYLSEGVKIPLKVQHGYDDNVMVAFGRLIVDKGVSFLFGPDVASKIEDPPTAGEQKKPPPDTGTAKPNKGTEAAQLWLDLCWKRNKRMLLLQKLATNGGICGHAFAKIISSKPFPRVIVLDPQLVDVDVDPDDCEEVTRFTITTPGTTGDGLNEAERPERRQIIQPTDARDQFNRPVEWLIVDQEKAHEGQWVTLQIATWPYPWPPILHCQNLPKPNDFWGESDLSADVIHLIDAINGTTSRQQKIVRLWAGPKAWARGMGNTSTIDLASDNVSLLPSETAELRTLDIKGDIIGARGHRDDLIDNLSWVTRTPTVAMGKPDQGGHLSGVALALRFMPIREKVQQKRNTYGDLVMDLDRHLLELGGFGALHETQIVWPELLPQDPLVERQVYVLDDSLGVASVKTISDQLGYDFETEQAQIEEEKQAAAALALKLAPPLPPGMGPGGQPPAAGGDPVPPPAKIPAPVPATAPRPRATS